MRPRVWLWLVAASVLFLALPVMWVRDQHYPLLIHVAAVLICGLLYGLAARIILKRVGAGRSKESP